MDDFDQPLFLTATPELQPGAHLSCSLTHDNLVVHIFVRDRSAQDERCFEGELRVEEGQWRVQQRDGGDRWKGAPERAW